MFVTFWCRYRALYNYKPQNDDELELKEGDTVYVMEKCDDGWYVGSSQRTGYFGTFPGNYVERLWGRSAIQDLNATLRIKTQDNFHQSTRRKP